MIKLLLISISVIEYSSIDCLTFQVEPALAMSSRAILGYILDLSESKKRAG
jgi:hypothetical protein